MKKKTLLLSVTIGIIIYSLVTICYGFIIYYSLAKSNGNLGDAGLFGDMFGAFNAFFTGLAFIGLAITIFLQVKENERVQIQIQEQKEEIKKEKEIDNYQKYVTGLSTTENELEFYLSKYRQISGEIGATVNAAQTGQPFTIPTYTFYPLFLEKQKIELSGFYFNSDLIKDIGHCHFELCHIIERLNLYKTELKGINQQNVTVVLGNALGFKGLVDSNIITYQNIITKIKSEINNIKNKIA
ncbi:MAG TPA: hypothetical protein PK559_12795 [Ignavibacteriaceae bacterium]|nr:hypothetical protein [Ignavibacteriaceae bacterium]